MRTVTLILMFAALSGLSATGWTSDSPDQNKQAEKNAAPGPLQPVREAVKGLEKAIAEEPPKAIRNLKEAVDKRLNRSRSDSGEEK